MSFVITIIMAMVIAMPLSASSTMLDKEPSVVSLDRMPEPVGGVAALGLAVKYPELAKKEGVEGVVLVKLTIASTGKIVKAEVSSPVRADLDQAALDAAKAVSWIPGKDKNGDSIETTIILPIKFKLAEKPKS